MSRSNVARTVPGAYVERPACLPPRKKSSRASRACRRTSSTSPPSSRWPRAAAARTSSTSAWAIPTVRRPKHIVDKLIETVSRPDTHGYSVSKGIPRLRRAICHWYAAPLRRRIRSGDRSDRHDRLEGGHRAPRAGDAESRRHGARSEPELSDPHLRPGHRRRGHPPRADDARRRLLRGARADDPHELPEAEDADHQLPVEPDGAMRRAAVLREDRRRSRASTASTSSTTSRTPTSASTAGRRRRSCRSRARATSPSSSSRCRRATTWPAGGSASWSATRISSTRWRGSRATTTTARSRRSRWRRSRRSKARRNASPTSRCATRSAATCWSRACTRPAGWSTTRKRRCTCGRRFPPPIATRGSLEFTKRLLAAAKVSVSPGIGFGEFGDDYVRFAMIENESRTRQAIRGIKQMFRDDGIAASRRGRPTSAKPVDAARPAA